MTSVPGLVMIDPSDTRRTVWVRAEDRADFEKRGYTAAPSEAERSAGEAKPAPVAEPEPPAPVETPPAEATTKAEEPPPAAVTFPRRAQRKKP